MPVISPNAGMTDDAAAIDHNGTRTAALRQDGKRSHFETANPAAAMRTSGVAGLHKKSSNATGMELHLNPAAGALPCA